jgi:hypothetical protein
MSPTSCQTAPPRRRIIGPRDNLGNSYAGKIVNRTFL